MLERDRREAVDRAAGRVHEIVHRPCVEEHPFDDRPAEAGMVSVEGCLERVEPALAPILFVLRRERRPIVEPIEFPPHSPEPARRPDVGFGSRNRRLAGAIAGVVLKVALPGRFDRLSIVVYLLLGWAAVIAAKPLYKSLPHATLVLLTVGGVVYSAGIIFYFWHSLKFQNAIWHSFVAAAAACRYAAIAGCVARAGEVRDEVRRRERTGLRSEVDPPLG